jgi:hypothetical protein
VVSSGPNVHGRSYDVSAVEVADIDVSMFLGNARGEAGTDWPCHDSLSRADRALIEAQLAVGAGEGDRHIGLVLVPLARTTVSMGR